MASFTRIEGTLPKITEIFLTKINEGEFDDQLEDLGFAVLSRLRDRDTAVVRQFVDHQYADSST